MSVSLYVCLCVWISSTEVHAHQVNSLLVSILPVGSVKSFLFVNYITVSFGHTVELSRHQSSESVLFLTAEDGNPPYIDVTECIVYMFRAMTL